MSLKMSDLCRYFSVKSSRPKVLRITYTLNKVVENLYKVVQNIVQKLGKKEDDTTGG